MINVLSIDIETKSSIDLKQGVHKYCSSPDFEILIFGYKADGLPAVCVDLANGEIIPAEVWEALNNPDTILKAWNAAFERVCIDKFFSIVTRIGQWSCTMVKAAFLGLPLSLGTCGSVVKVKAAKDPAGEKLIRFFTVPQKATKKDPEAFWNTRASAPDKWQAFKSYCISDVESEAEIDKRVSLFPLPEFEKKLYVIDQKINDRGVRVDLVFITAAIELDQIIKKRLVKEGTDDYGISITSDAQVKEWLEKDIGEPIGSLNKNNMPFVEEKVTSERGKRLLELRNKVSKTSIRKYYRMEESVMDDECIRGLFQFCGANRTHRWGGRSVQPQNLPKNPSSEDMPDLQTARELVLEGDLETLEMLFGDPSDIISKLIRLAFISHKGKTLAPCDYAAIEARVIAWIAQELWKIEVFNGDGKIYEATGARMWNIPKEQITKGSPTRDKAKIAELALGFGGGPRALLPKARELKMTQHVIYPARKEYDDMIDAQAGSQSQELIIKGRLVARDAFVSTHAKEEIQKYLAANYCEADLKRGGAWSKDEILLKHMALITKKWDLVYTDKLASFSADSRFYHIENKKKTLMTRFEYVELKEMESLRPIVVAWREANPAIVALWKRIEKIAIAAVRNPGEIYTYEFASCTITYQVLKGILFCRLPSGGRLAYCRPKIYPGKYGDALMYEGIGENSKWTRIPTYGGSLTENIVQAEARNVLGTAMIRLDEAGFDLVLHVHDEAVPEIDDEQAEENLKYIEELMGLPIDWAPGLPLRADGFLTKYYRKD